MNYLYALLDPTYRTVMYVGLTNCPKRRFREHISTPHNAFLKTYISDLKSKGLKPVMRIIASNSCLAAEKKYIKQLKPKGNFIGK